MSSSYRPDDEHASNSSANTRLTCRYSTPFRSNTNPLGSRNDAPSRVKLLRVFVEQRDEERFGCSARSSHESESRDDAGYHYLEDETACCGIDVHRCPRFVRVCVDFRAVNNVRRSALDHNAGTSPVQSRDAHLTYRSASSTDGIASGEPYAVSIRQRT